MTWRTRSCLTSCWVSPPSPIPGIPGSSLRHRGRGGGHDPAASRPRFNPKWSHLPRLGTRLCPSHCLRYPPRPGFGPPDSGQAPALRGAHLPRCRGLLRLPSSRKADAFLLGWCRHRSKASLSPSFLISSDIREEYRFPTIRNPRPPAHAAVVFPVAPTPPASLARPSHLRQHLRYPVEF